MNNSYNQMNGKSTMGFLNNNLISEFQNFQKNNIPFQNNALLNNNPHFVNMMNNQQVQMMSIYNHMAKYKQAQEMKKMQKVNDVSNVFDQALIYESVIRPIKVVKENSTEFQNKYKELECNWKTEKEKAWSQRTNQPYKNILKDENYNKFIGKQNINKDELIVHKVTDADKIGLLEEFQDLLGILEKHNSDLKIIYSANKELEHKQKFEYVHRDKYKIKYDPKDYEELKKDQLDYYKKEQYKLEKDKKTVDDIIESLLNKGILNEADIKNIENDEKTLENDDNISDLEKQLRNELGDDYEKLEREAKKILNSDVHKDCQKVIQKEGKNKIQTNYHETKPIKEEKNTKKVSVKTRVINKENKNHETDDNKLHKNISTNIDELKLKYLSRQKK